MPTRIAPVSFLLAFSMAASLHAQQGPLIQLRGIADVAVERTPGPILSFSSTGEDLLVEYPETGGRAPMQLVPGPAGERSRDRGEPYRLRKIISLDSAQSTLTIIERPRSDGTWAAGGRVLARDSVRYMGKRLEVTPEPSPEAEAFATADGITFENAAGMPLKPGMPLATHHPPISVSGGTTGLYARKGDSRTDVLGGPHKCLSEFSYDGVKRRILVHGNDYILFDLDAGTRRVYERGYKNPEANTEK
ncbi:MAG TPA: hypothetical protein VM492_18910, partial [Sumerlaeia bacterium]|nr:hypothetical protein [Sumerlaeia bacterium]